MAFLLTRTVAEVTQAPTAQLVASPTYAVIGSVIRLDARGSSDPAGLDLSYHFSVVSAPIGSKASLLEFTEIDEEPGYVSFSPDLIGSYTVRVAVSNGSYYGTADASVDLRAILVPHANGVVPDGKFIWSYLRDAWTQVDGREFFETLWSALIQISGAELLKLYQVDYDKSINDIQSLFQRRWLPYEPRLDLDPDNLSLYLGDTMAGTGAVIGPTGLAGQLAPISSTEVVVVKGTIRPDAVGQALTVTYSQAPENLTTYRIAGVMPSRSSYRLETPLNSTADVIADGAAFSFSGPGQPPLVGGPLTWLRPGSYFALDFHVGDAIVVRSGVNAGFYIITAVTSDSVTVDRHPPKYSDGAVCTVYRPLSFSIAFETVPISNTIGIELEGNEGLLDLAPGRLVVVNGQGYTITRVSADSSQRVPLAVLGVDRPIAWTGLSELSWRVPNTLVSATQNFEELGVSAGDALVVSVGTTTLSTELKLTVVGVDRDRLGFIVTNADAEVGVVPPIPDEMYRQLAADLGIEAVTSFGSIQFSETAGTVMQYLRSPLFQTAFWNQKLVGEIQVVVAGLTFSARPVAVIRNSLIPVDDDLRSVPALQEQIVFAEFREEDGVVYQVRNGQEMTLNRKPLALKEGSHYLVDTPTIELELTFRTGTDVVEADAADFLDAGVTVGDTFAIESPLAMAGDYKIVQVLGQNAVLLDRVVERLSQEEYVAARIVITRSRIGHYLRFVPGLFSARSSAPDRLWAEVSFFDNSEAIEKNFGLLVGLRRQDLSDSESTVEYRQAVTGIMYALAKGSSLNKIRLGAQILLGLPFAEHRGILRNIDPEARKDFATGEPTHGRILIEDVDSTDAPTGVYRYYFFPLDPESDLAGIEVNPATGLPYAVGDIVERFVPLCKGVEVEDYVSNPGTLPSLYGLLQRYHGIRLRANDLVFKPKESKLVSDFLKRITPSYVASYLTMLTEALDDLEVDEDTLVRLRTSEAEPPIADDVALGLPFALRFDQRSLRAVSTAFYDDGVFVLRRAGVDLSTDGASLTVAAAGLLNPRTGEIFEAPLCEVGDKLVIRFGPNIGTYTISAITDSTLTVSDGPQEGFEQLQDQAYAIMRAVEPRLWSGTGTFVEDEDTVLLANAALRTHGVMPGDIIVLQFGTDAERRSIVSVEESTPGSGVWDTVQVSVPVSASGSGTPCSIFRPAFYRGESTEAYSIEADGTQFLVSASPELMALCEIGDELLLYEREDRLRLTMIDAANLYVTPALAAGTYAVLLCKRWASSAVSFDLLSAHVPYDEVAVSLSGGSGGTVSVPTASTVSFDVPNTLPTTVRPGDQLVFTSGLNASGDSGYGPGVFVVAWVDGTTVHVTSASLTPESGARFKLVRRVFRA